MHAALSPSSPTIITLKPIEATPENFAPFGQVISASSDGDKFGPQDAQLELHRGVPRFYIMQLEDQKPKFSSITHHASVTQCLGPVGGGEWYLGIAKPSILNESEIGNEDGRKPIKARCGHYYIPPNPNEVCVFRFSGPKFVKLNVGTWHAGPLFEKKTMHFYNLELSNTNEQLKNSTNTSAKRRERERSHGEDEEAGDRKRRRGGGGRKRKEKKTKTRFEEEAELEYEHDDNEEDTNTFNYYDDDGTDKAQNDLAAAGLEDSDIENDQGANAAINRKRRALSESDDDDEPRERPRGFETDDEAEGTKGKGGSGDDEEDVD